jgi:hypothetical protein
MFLLDGGGLEYLPSADKTLSGSSRGDIGEVAEEDAREQDARSRALIERWSLFNGSTSGRVEGRFTGCKSIYSSLIPNFRDN